MRNCVHSGRLEPCRAEFCTNKNLAYAEKKRCILHENLSIKNTGKDYRDLQLDTDKTYSFNGVVFAVVQSRILVEMKI